MTWEAGELMLVAINNFPHFLIPLHVNFIRQSHVGLQLSAVFQQVDVRNLDNTLLKAVYIRVT